MPLTAHTTQSRPEFLPAPARVPPMLAQFLAGVTDGDAASALHGAVAAGLDRLPLPGSGATLARW